MWRKSHPLSAHPARGCAKRRRPSFGAGNPDRPAHLTAWAPTKNSNSRNDILVFEKRVICKVHDPRRYFVGTPPLNRGADWSGANSIGPIRRIATQLRGVGKSAVSWRVAEASRSGGSLRSSAAGGRKEKGPMVIKMKDVAPER